MRSWLDRGTGARCSIMRNTRTCWRVGGLRPDSSSSGYWLEPIVPGNILRSPPRLLNGQAVWHRSMNLRQWSAGALSAGAPRGRTVPFRLRTICPCCWGAVSPAELVCGGAGCSSMRARRFDGVTTPGVELRLPKGDSSGSEIGNLLCGSQNLLHILFWH